MNLEENYAQILSYNFQVAYKRTTFFDISGYPHYENVISNWYAFFLNPKAEHGFNTLFLDALSFLLKDLNITMPEINEHCIEREYGTENYGRIDLLISEKNQDNVITRAVLIENKVFAGLCNDLDDYWNCVKVSNDNKVGILLTLKPIPCAHPGFVNITHDKWLSKVMDILPQYWQNANDRHLLFLRDYMENFKRMTGLTENMTEEIEFLSTHGEKINELQNLYKEAIKNINNWLIEIMGGIGWEKNSITSATVSFKKADSKAYCYISVHEIFSHKKVKVTLWLKGVNAAEILKKNLVIDEITKYSSLLNLNIKNEGADWTKLADKEVLDIGPINYVTLQTILQKEFETTFMPFFDAIELSLLEKSSQAN